MPKRKDVLRFLTYLMLLTGVCLFNFSCNGPGRKYKIQQKALVDILVDIHIADAMSNEVMGPEYNYRLDTTTLYNSVYEKHHVTKAMFDSTMAYYASHPEDLKKIYDKVTSRLGVMESTFAAADTLNHLNRPVVVWQDTKIHALPQMGPTNRVEIDIPVKTPGEYMLSAKIKIFNDDESEQPHMTIYFWYDNDQPEGFREYFADVPLKKDEKTNTYIATKRLTNPKVTDIRGYILNHTNGDSLFKKHALVTLIKVTRMP